MQIFKTRAFARWARDEDLGDAALAFAVAEMERGLIDAKLGGPLIKKRVALSGRGKRGSTRTVIAYRQCDKAFFIYGFAKNAKDNITARELQALRLLARTLLSYPPAALATAVIAGELIEIEV
jgi:hypothetical protein